MNNPNTTDVTGAPIKGICQCDLCKRGREFERRISTLSEDDRKWMMEFYCGVIETEAELEMRTTGN